MNQPICPHCGIPYKSVSPTAPCPRCGRYAAAPRRPSPLVMLLICAALASPFALAIGALAWTLGSDTDRTTEQARATKNRKSRPGKPGSKTQRPAERSRSTEHNTASSGGAKRSNSSPPDHGNYDRAPSDSTNQAQDDNARDDITRGNGSQDNAPQDRGSQDNGSPDLGSNTDSWSDPFEDSARPSGNSDSKDSGAGLDSQTPTSPVELPGRELAYRWSVGTELAYEFTIDASEEDGAVVDRFEGEVVFRPTLSEMEDLDLTSDGSGTGFVVRSDGIIATCAHVIEDATAITVRLGDQEFPATVLAVHLDDDVALLRIDHQCDKVLPLADSDSVPLAEEVRAIGFPLSTFLGESLKVARGEISGVISRGSSPRFQTDATLNPGNSGGPVLNNRGAVVGLASAFITGERINSVGLVIPSNLLRDLMTEHGVAPTATPQLSQLDGPTLVEHSRDGVAYIEVKTGPVGSLSRVDFVGYYQPLGQSASREATSGRLMFDARGRIWDSSAKVQLPYFLGELSSFCIDGVPGDGREQWRIQNDVTLRYEMDDEPTFPRFGRGVGLSPFGGNTRRIESIDARETYAYRRVAQRGNDVEVHLTYHLRRVGDNELLMEGEGTVLFDTASSQLLSRSMTFSMQDAEKAPMSLAVSIKRQDGRFTPDIALLGDSASTEGRKDKELGGAPGRVSPAAPTPIATAEASTGLPGSVAGDSENGAVDNASLQSTPPANSVRAINVRGELEEIEWKLPVAAKDRSMLPLIELDSEVSEGHIALYDDLGWNVSAMAFSPDGTLLVATTLDGDMHVFDNIRGSRLHRIEQASETSVSFLKFVAEGEFWAVERNSFVRRYKLNDDAKPIGATAKPQGSGTPYAFDASGHSICLGRRGTVDVWMTQDDPSVSLTGFQGAVRWAEFNHDGTRVIASDGAKLAVFDPQRSAVTGVLHLADRPADHVAISTDRKYLFTTSGKNALIYATESGKKMATAELPMSPWSIAGIQQSDLFAIGARGMVYVLDRTTGRVVQELPATAPLYVQTMASAPDGRHLAIVTSAARQPIELFRLPAP